MKELLNLKEKLEANLSVALKEVAQLTNDTLEERRPVAVHCVKSAGELGKDFVAEAITIIDELSEKLSYASKEIKQLEDANHALNGLRGELGTLNIKLKEANDLSESQENVISNLQSKLDLSNKELSALRPLTTKVKSLESQLNRSEKASKKKKVPTATLR